jgi:peptide subunit release factor 1 (eRF1)
VLTALERGEVQTILIGRGFAAAVVECPQCGHLDTRMVKDCALCGHGTRELHDVTDSLIARAVRGGADLIEVDDAEFSRVGNIAALLRFRADQSTARKLAM